MTKILLTGAGFSRNWGAPLAAEVFEYLLGCPEIDDALRDELWKDNNRGLGFENTLGRLQEEMGTGPRDVIAKQIEALTSALAGMFNWMDQGIQRAQFEFQNDLQYCVGPFLARFDAIFTLNQDLLLERHYFSGMPLMPTRRWNGIEHPGVGHAGPMPHYHPNLVISAPRSPLPETDFKTDLNFQPYFKLHGSSNWFDRAGGRLLVMGGNKTATIGAVPLLRWYAQQFDQYLQRGGVRLMVIGYSFSDPHINRSIIDACSRGLEVFIIDPAGVSILDKRGSRPLRAARDELMEAVQPKVIGASRRPLTGTFGGDHVEHDKLAKFFA